MPVKKNLSDLHETAELPALIVTLESLYAREITSPLSASKSTDQKYTELMNLTADMLFNKLGPGSFSSTRDVPLTSLFSIAEMMLLSLAKEKEILIKVMDPGYSGDYLANHSLNVAFLSCEIGKGMELSYRELCELGVAALVHDIGMLKVDSSLYNKKEGLTQNERAALEEHPRLGFLHFEKCKKDVPWLLRVILEEHKREQGNGYPDDLLGEQHPYSKIVGICDTFEALTHVRPHRKPFHPADAIKAIMAGKGTLYTSDALRTMIDTLGMFPVGSMVRLNNKKEAFVTQSVWRAPLRPIVRIIQENGVGAEEKIDLSKDNNLSITGIIYHDQYQIPHI
jgi:HD-GYP domain-containing protein (c-di-GMP phosphodiesterase class II)